MRRGAIIVASGRSRRMGFDKLLAELAGEAVLRHSVRAFLDCEEVVVVTDQKRFASLAGLKGNLSRVDGGEERSDSVRAGLAALSDQVELVAIHDGARPLIGAGETEECFLRAAENGAAALARRVTETIKRADPAGIVCDSVDRENLWTMETPQVFQLGLLRNAYAEVAARGLSVTDEVSALQIIGEPVSLIENRFP